MKIALISDTHDHLERLAEAVNIFHAFGAQALIHAGDVVSPFTAEKMTVFNGPIRAVFGNCDGERRGISGFISSIAEPPVSFELAGRRFVLAHSESQISADLLETAEVAVVGHTHSPQQTRRGNTLLVNPGECCGRVTGQATVALLDSEDLSVEVINLT